MPSIQEVIHKLEEGEGVRYVKMAALGLAFVALIALYNLREYQNFGTQEAMDAAQVGRNLAQGNGYTTQFIRPISLHLVGLQRTNVLEDPMLLVGHHPDLANPPVYPVLLAGLFKFLPIDFELSAAGSRYQPEIVISWLNQILFVVSGLVLFRLARICFDRSVAWLCTILFFGADLLWRFSVSGLSTMLLLLIFLLITWCLVSMETASRAEAEEDPDSPQRGTIWFLVRAVALGLLVGIGGLTRYAFIWLTIPVVIFLFSYFQKRRVMLGLVTLGVVVLTLLPWLWRNHQISGNWFGTAGYAMMYETLDYPENRIERTLDWTDRKIDLSDYLRKLVVNAGRIVQEDLPTIGGSWISMLFLVGLLIPFSNPALQRLRVFLLSCIFLLVLVQSLGRTYLSDSIPAINSENLLVLMAPLTFMYGAGLYFTLVDQLELPFVGAQQIITILVAALGCAPLVFHLLPPRTSPLVYPPYSPSVFQEVGEWCEEDELMMSDVPWAIAWYSNRTCLWHTHTIDPDFFTINDQHRPVDAVLLTPKTTDGVFASKMIKSPDWAWGRFFMDVLLRENIPEGFPLKFARRDFMPDFFYITDWPRWNNASEQRD